MQHEQPYRPRLSVDIPQELRDKLRRYIPWGVLGKIVVIMLEDVVAAIEKDPKVLGALLSRYAKYKDVEGVADATKRS